MTFSVFNESKRAERIYTTEELAEKDARARNAKAEYLGIKARYSVEPYVMTAADGKENIRDTFYDLPDVRP